MRTGGSGPKINGYWPTWNPRKPKAALYIGLTGKNIDLRHL